MRRFSTVAGVAIASLRAGRTGVRVAFSEPHGPAFLHYQLLRDACPCAQCRDPRTLQRTADTLAAVLPGLRPARLGLTAERALALTWPDAHESVFPPGELLARAAAPAAADAASDAMF
jgi:DUF971 family protein